MKITKVELGMLSVPLRVPFKTARRRVDSVEDVIVLIRTDTGATGYGEAPPTGVVTGDTTGGIIDAIRTHLAPLLVGRNVNEFEDLIQSVQTALIHNSSAKAAVDMALYDLYGQLWDIPVHKLLGGAKNGIVTDITISVNAPEEMARDARDAIARGYDTLKIKVGIDPSLDVTRLTAVREAVGKDVRIRIDANQAWKPREAVRILAQMAEKGLDIELVEQPVAAADIDGLAYVTVTMLDGKGVSVPDADDELSFSVSGAGRFKAVCNGDPTSLESFAEPHMKLFHGKLVVIIERTAGKGDVTLTVHDRKRDISKRITLCGTGNGAKGD